MISSEVSAINLKSNTIKSQSMYQRLCEKNAMIGVIGLGYVGLPLALEFAKDFKVIGFDINESKVSMMEEGVDPCNELSNEVFDEKDIQFTSIYESLDKAEFYIVTVPTPVNKNKQPDLNPLIKACKALGVCLGKGNIVVFESTVYPGCTEEVCVPILESVSGLKLNEDFKVGYSPERINPGDRKNTLTKIKKITSGSDVQASLEIYNTYNHIIKAGIYPAPSIKVAEAAKIIENAQRDVNIAFMNELSLLFNELGIETSEVLKAAGTKWNFLPFFPGLVGGHCIGVDPYYLIHKAHEHQIEMPVISASRKINDSMSQLIVNRITSHLIKSGKDLFNAKGLILGATFKPNVSDTRNAKPIEIYNKLTQAGIHVDIVDPMVDKLEFENSFNILMTEAIGDHYDLVIYAVDHEKFAFLNSEKLISKIKKGGVFYDFTNRFRNGNFTNPSFQYFSF